VNNLAHRGPASNDADAGAADIRDQLRGDHDRALAELDALHVEGDEARASERLVRLRRAWVIHALAEESVVYRALEGESNSSASHSDERFVEHELIEGLFDKLTRIRPGSHEWAARLSVVHHLVARHIDTEQSEIFARLAARLDAEALQELGRNFVLARDKLMMLEEAKAA
jgi:hemerythrin-like domain-containing protein